MGKSKWVMLGVLSCVLSSPAAQAGLIAYLAMDGQDGSQIFTDSQGGGVERLWQPPPLTSALAKVFREGHRRISMVKAVASEMLSVVPFTSHQGNSP